MVFLKKNKSLNNQSLLLQLDPPAVLGSKRPRRPPFPNNGLKTVWLWVVLAQGQQEGPFCQNALKAGPKRRNKRLNGMFFCEVDARTNLDPDAIFCRAPSVRTFDLVSLFVYKQMVKKV